jgi:hypothetical protein
LIATLDRRFASATDAVQKERREEARRIAREQRARDFYERDGRDIAASNASARLPLTAAVLTSAAAASLLCCDGTESGTCSCHGNYQGCCAHHGGVCGCSH